MEVSEKIKNRCNKAGLSISEMLRMSNVSHETFRLWTIKTPPILSHLEKIRDFLGMDTLLDAFNYILHNPENIPLLEQETGVPSRQMKYWIAQGPPKTVDLYIRIDSTLQVHGA